MSTCACAYISSLLAYICIIYINWQRQFFRHRASGRRGPLHHDCRGQKDDRRKEGRHLPSVSRVLSRTPTVRIYNNKNKIPVCPRNSPVVPREPPPPPSLTLSLSLLPTLNWFPSKVQCHHIYTATKSIPNHLLFHLSLAPLTHP